MKRLLLDVFVLSLVVAGFFAAMRLLLGQLGWEAGGYPTLLVISLGVGAILGLYLRVFQRPFCLSLAQSQKKWPKWIFVPAVGMFVLLALFSLDTPLQAALFTLFALINLTAAIQHWRLRTSDAR